MLKFYTESQPILELLLNVNILKVVFIKLLNDWFVGCGHCRDFKPNFIAASDILKERKIISKLAAFETTGAEKFTEKYQVKGYPTLIYFK